MSTKILDPMQWTLALQAKRSKVQHKYLAFYSSYLQAISTDASVFSIPLDDHLIHRGHGVYDTGTVAHGRLYEFRRHVTRFLRSAEGAEIAHYFTEAEIIARTLDTVHAAAVHECSVRLWLSPGPGNFSVTANNLEEPCLYILAYLAEGYPSPYTLISEVTVSCTEVPMKDKASAAVKSVNYLLNAKMATEAKRKGGFLGIWVDDQSFVKEGSVNNVSIVDKDGNFATPSFDGILRGCTLLHVFEILAEHAVHVRQRPVTYEELLAAREVVITGGDTHVYSVVNVDHHIIGDGQMGPVTRLLIDSIQRELADGSGDTISVFD
jgi:4-amino-4-deoxychorismate lyase